MRHSIENATVRTTEHIWIPMPDGVRLSARIWWPKGRAPFPALLEYIPYRKRDMVRARDARNHPYFAAHGFVCLRVDMRGSGDSEGDMPDMYSDDELKDARTIINWIAEQTWCSGRVGMFGTSWGGTASLQAAVNAPVALKAVIANCATADRFEDDIHWMGGGLLTDGFEWGATLPAILAAPPDLQTVGSGWRDLWRTRLQKLSFPLDAWIRHDFRGQYWRHGSIAFSAAQLACPVLAIGGWSDRYSNSVMALVRMRPDICWGIVGPWGHHYPDQGEPGPAIGFQDLALEWWNHWLKGDARDALSWPRLRIWQREFDPPQDRLTVRNGEWRETDDLQANSVATFFLTPGGLAKDATSEKLQLNVPNDLRHGECAGDTGYFGRRGGLPLDQSADDARSLCFDSEPLAEDLVLSGHAEVSVDVARDLAVALLVCRICEVTPDDRSNLVIRQVRNLALDATLDSVASHLPDHPVHYRIRMPSTAYRFARGNRLRLAFGTSYWPLVWPITKAANVHILLHQARLGLPRLVHTAPLSIPFPKVKKLPVQDNWDVVPTGQLQRKQAACKDHQVETSWNLPKFTVHFSDTNCEFSMQTSAHYRLNSDSAVIVEYEIRHEIEIRRADGTARITCDLNSKANETGLTVIAQLSAVWNDEAVSDRVWHREYSTFPQDRQLNQQSERGP